MIPRGKPVETEVGPPTVIRDPLSVCKSVSPLYMCLWIHARF